MKVLLPLCLLIMIITVGFLVALNPFNWPLRHDRIPEGAFVVPWMQPSPHIESLEAVPLGSQPWDLAGAMRGSLSINITFRVNLPNGTRSIPSTVYLGHDNDLLYVGGIFRGMYANPSSNGSRLDPSFFNLLLNVENDGILRRPESGLIFGAFVGCPFNPNLCGIGSGGWGAGDFSAIYSDLAWTGNPSQPYWVVIDDLQTDSRCIQPSAIGRMASEYNTISGTLAVLISRHLSTARIGCGNALQILPGETWVMGFLLEFGFTNESGFTPSLIDGWPLAYRWGSNDASQWPKLAIDLSNPP